MRDVSVDAVKEAAGGLQGKEIGIHFQGYGSPGRGRSRGWIPELEVAEDFFDDGRVIDKADDAQPSAAFGAGEGIGGPDFADQAGPGAFGVAAEVVGFGFGSRDGCGNDGGGALLFQAALPPGLVTVVSAIPYDLLSLFGDKGSQGGQGVQRGELFRVRGGRDRA